LMPLKLRSSSRMRVNVSSQSACGCVLSTTVL
jgi:hypothetical protein